MANAEKLCTDIDELLSHGGFSTKGFTVSGKPPISSLSKDGVSVHIVGIKWYPEDDKVKLAVGSLNFYKKSRGKNRREDNASIVPDALTKRICLGKVSEIFDLWGLVAPIIAGFKIDLHELVISLYKWDDPLSVADREKWITNFDIMGTLRDGVWSRAIIPIDAVSLDIDRV